MTSAEKNRARAAAWQKANPERRREIRAKWVANNLEKMRAMRAAWKKANASKVREERAKWMREHPEQRAANEATRRALKANSGGRYTAAEIRQLVVSQSDCCAICAVKLNGVFHRDHIMPLALGGSNGIENIQLLCPTCNCKKGANHPTEYAKKLSLSE